MQKHVQTWAIFCKIVDNFGDIGVCWRLAKQLANECNLTHTARPPISVTLYIDDFNIAQKLIPALKDVNENATIIVGSVRIMHLNAANESVIADVAIETFSCGLPEKYLKCMSAQQTFWINVDYLSAEDWVADYHGKPSIHPQLNITKHYFFPGFNQNTGGLLRESGLVEARDTFDALGFLNHLSQIFNTRLNKKALNISLFCYPQANVHALFNALNNEAKSFNIWLPFNVNLKDFFKDLGVLNYTINEVIQLNNINIFVLPFLSQSDYDHLLWSCDLNFVRGEDSWVRAIWAAKPFIWQPYIQSESTHLLKLNAFLQTHYPLSPSGDVAKIMQNAHLLWSDALDTNKAQENIWSSVFKHINIITRYHQNATQKLIALPDLANQLVSFVQKKLAK
jgi:uncharacterized repeat protein (TIGR03837 family)